jgi:RNA recognition motif-containing protein
MDKETGRSKGYGFVKFTSSRSYDDALAEANGQVPNFLQPSGSVQAVL